MFPYMRTQNWLYHYRTDEGMYKSFGGVARRAKYITETDTAFRIFLENKAFIRSCYHNFFPRNEIICRSYSGKIIGDTKPITLKKNKS